jgi:hypothetical protein
MSVLTCYGRVPGWITAWAILVVAGCAAPTPEAASVAATADAASAPSSPLGSYLAARHAQEVHDYASAA